MSIQPGQLASTLSRTEKTFPADSLFHSLSYLDLKSLAHCCSVNRTWRDLGSNDILWKALFPRLIIPEGTSVKAHINRLKPINPVYSFEELLQREDSFFSTITFGQKISFKSLFPLNANSISEISLGYGYERQQKLAAKDVCTLVIELPVTPLSPNSSFMESSVRNTLDPNVKVSIRHESMLPSEPTTRSLDVRISRVGFNHTTRLRDQAPPRRSLYEATIAAVISVISAIFNDWNQP